MHHGQSALLTRENQRRPVGRPSGRPWQIGPEATPLGVETSARVEYSRVSFDKNHETNVHGSFQHEAAITPVVSMARRENSRSVVDPRDLGRDS